jgi:uncharacterized protein (TIGR02217 family)
MAFYEVQLDSLISYGSSFGLIYATVVTAVPSRSEQRIQQQSRAYRQAKLTFDNKSLEQMQNLREMFMLVEGKTHGFRAKDWQDYKAVAESITCIDTDGVFTAQLQKTYHSA